jgi:hypothetical protein
LTGCRPLPVELSAEVALFRFHLRRAAEHLVAGEQQHDQAARDHQLAHGADAGADP